jgi:signal transduction histidine kinase
MFLALLLVSFVVLKITDRAIFKQRIWGGDRIFSTITTSFTQLLKKNPSLLDRPSPRSELQELARLYGGNELFEQITFINKDGVILAHTDENMIGQTLLTSDFRQAMISKHPLKKVLTSKSDSQRSLSIASPLYLQENLAGGLRIVFPLRDVQQDIARSKKMIFFYILFDLLILMLIGTFLLSRYLAKPIDKLIKLTEEISEGNLDSPLHLSDRNEIGKLSASLHSMADKIKEGKKKVQEHIHALEEKNQQLQQAQQEVIQSEKLASIGRLAAGIAHEIGNPIGIILGFLHMLRNEKLDEHERLDYLKRMEVETERINSIIREVLDYAHPSSQNRDVLDLNKVVNDTYPLLAYQKDFQNIKVNFDLEPELPPMYADNNRLRQVIINLVLNALDAMPNGGTLQFKTCLNNSGDKDEISFTITDTGEGIPFEDQQKIFDPFFTTKAPGKGTGLGLSNSHRIVDSLGGKIVVSSSSGKGTAFTITFPTVKDIS